jgi:hypothetical protein
MSPSGDRPVLGAPASHHQQTAAQAEIDSKARAEIPKQIRRRRDASRRLPVLEDGRADPIEPVRRKRHKPIQVRAIGANTVEFIGGDTAIWSACDRLGVTFMRSRFGGAWQVHQSNADDVMAWLEFAATGSTSRYEPAARQVAARRHRQQGYRRRDPRPAARPSRRDERQGPSVDLQARPRGHVDVRERPIQERLGRAIDARLLDRVGGGSKGHPQILQSAPAGGWPDIDKMFSVPAFSGAQTPLIDQSGPLPRVWGSPIYESSSMATATGAGTRVIIYGDFSQTTSWTADPVMSCSSLRSSAPARTRNCPPGKPGGSSSPGRGWDRQPPAPGGSGKSKAGRQTGHR